VPLTDHQSMLQQAQYWEALGHKRGQSRPRRNDRSTIKEDSQKMRLSWEAAAAAALDRLKNGVRLWPNAFI